MRSLVALTLVGGLCVASGCSMLMGGGGGGGMDMAKSTADNGQASYMVQIHKGAEVGQWCESEASGMKMWWGVTDKKGDNLVVENRNIMAGMPGMTTAYVVDADGNVLEAYVANWDAKAEKLSTAYKMKIMAKPEPAAAGTAPEVKTGDESVNAAGKDWACTWTEVDAGGKPAKSWICKDGWFGGLIKSEYDGKVSMALTACGTDAKRGFEFPKEEAAK